MELSVLQLAILGLIASAIVEGVKIVRKNNPELGGKIGRKAITIVLFVVSAMLAAVWSGTVQPLQATDPMAMAAEIVARLSAIAGVATVLYNILLEKVFEKMGGSDEVGP